MHAAPPLRHQVYYFKIRDTLCRKRCLFNVQIKVDNVCIVSVTLVHVNSYLQNW